MTAVALFVYLFGLVWQLGWRCFFCWSISFIFYWDILVTATFLSFVSQLC